MQTTIDGPLRITIAALLQISKKKGLLHLPMEITRDRILQITLAGLLKITIHGLLQIMQASLQQVTTGGLSSTTIAGPVNDHTQSFANSKFANYKS